jgi:ATP-dependent Clp protease ATP-binding subunit ClpA
VFERFTQEARETVIGAQVEARQLRDERVGTEHLLLALLAQDTPSTAVLSRYGLTHDSVAETLRGYRSPADDLDADALTTLGIDLDAVRDRVEATFGPGALDGEPGRRAESPAHVPFSPRARKVLELSLREALAMRSRTIRDGHIALGLLREGQGLAMKALHDRGVDLVELRRDLTAALAS